MSSVVLQRGIAAAVVGSRPLSSMVAAGQHFNRSQQHDFPHQDNAHPGIPYRDQPLTFRGLAHSTKGETNTTEQQPRQHHKKTMQSLEQPSHSKKHQEHVQTHRLQHQTRRPTTTQAQQSSGAMVEGAVPSDDGFIDKTYSALASQKAFHETVEDWAHTSFLPETRLQAAVERFRNRFFVDELPCRTRKSVAEAAAAGKGYITAGDISRVFETISDESNLLTEDEAHAIIHAAWTRQGSGTADSREDGGQARPREAGTLDGLRVQTGTSPNAGAASAAAGAKISTEEFILVLAPKKPSKSK